MGTKAKPSQLRVPAGVQQWQAERARRARARTDPSQGRDYRWPGDREVIIAETVAAARGGKHQVNADPPGVCGAILATARLA